MESFTAVAVGALAKLARKLKELRTAATRRCNVADENRAEQGVPLEDMDRSGIRNRLSSAQASGSANDNPDSPSTTSGESGTITPGSDENSENQGMNAVQQVQHVKRLTQRNLRRFLHQDSLVAAFRWMGNMHGLLEECGRARTN